MDATRHVLVRLCGGVRSSRRRDNESYVVVQRHTCRRSYPADTPLWACGVAAASRACALQGSAYKASHLAEPQGSRQVTGREAVRSSASEHARLLLGAWTRRALAAALNRTCRCISVLTCFLLPQEAQRTSALLR